MSFLGLAWRFALSSLCSYPYSFFLLSLTGRRGVFVILFSSWRIVYWVVVAWFYWKLFGFAGVTSMVHKIRLSIQLSGMVSYLALEGYETWELGNSLGFSFFFVGGLK